VAGEPLLAYEAIHRGHHVAEVIAGLEPEPADTAVPAAVFTDPEIATIGMTEAEGEDEGYLPLVGCFPFRANVRALITEASDRFVKLVFDANGNVLLGAQIVGPDTSGLVEVLSFAVPVYATALDLADFVAVHPTLSEAVVEAAQRAFGTATHVQN